MKTKEKMLNLPAMMALEGGKGGGIVLLFFKANRSIWQYVRNKIII